MKIVFVSGLKEIDRKTIIELALQRAGRKRDFKIVNFDAIGDIKEEIEVISDMNNARRLLDKFYENIEKSMIEAMKEQPNGLVINGYLTFKTRHGYVRVLPEEFFRSFKPDCIVLLEMQQDGWGKIDPEKIEHQHINRYFAMVYASLIGSTFKIIRFREKKMLDAVESLSDILK
jgi:adenylate kinase